MKSAREVGHFIANKWDAACCHDPDIGWSHGPRCDTATAAIEADRASRGTGEREPTREALEEAIQRRDAEMARRQASLEVAVRALEEIRDKDVFLNTRCDRCGRLLSRDGDHDLGHPCGIASRALAALRAATAGESTQETVSATLYDAAMTALLTLQLDVVRLVDEARERQIEQVARWLDWAGEKRWVPEYCAKRLRDGSWLPDLAAPDSAGDAGTGEGT